MTSDQLTGAQVPLVSYLELDPPHLVANECTRCGARYFDRRNACASCGGEAFSPVYIDTEGKVRTFSIVAFSIPGGEVAFGAAGGDCGGTRGPGGVTSGTPHPQPRNVGVKVKMVPASQ